MRPISLFSLVLILSIAAGLAGCAAQSSPTVVIAPPFSSERLEALRASYKVTFPNAQIGMVTAVLPDRPFVLVGQIDTTNTRVGSIVTLIDSNETVITTGRVELIDPNGLTVRFDNGKRRPAVGDAAIKF